MIQIKRQTSPRAADLQFPLVELKQGKGVAVEQFLVGSPSLLISFQNQVDPALVLSAQ